MSRPSSPVSGCTLRRVEIRSGGGDVIHELNNPEQDITFSIESQKIPRSKKSGLVLLIHSGARQVFSIRLNDLLASKQAIEKAILMDSARKKLRLLIEKNDQTVSVEFEGSRDFNLTLCMLEKIGFNINDAKTSNYTKADETHYFLPQAPSTPPADLGPRLSSFTPIPSTDWLLQYAKETRTSENLTNNAPFGQFQLTESNGSYTGPSSPSLATRLSQSVRAPDIVSNTPDRPLLNPYDAFLGFSNKESYVPRVGSSLRSFVRPGEDIRPSPTPPTQAELDLKSESQSQRASSFNMYQPIDRGISVPLSNIGTNLGNDLTRNNGFHAPQWAMGAAQQRSNPPGRATDFRKMLPKPRTLPFEQQARKRESVPSAIQDLQTLEPARTRSLPEAQPASKRLKASGAPLLAPKSPPARTEVRTRALNKRNATKPGQTELKSTGKVESNTKPDQVVAATEVQDQKPLAAIAPTRKSTRKPRSALRKKAGERTPASPVRRTTPRRLAQANDNTAPAETNSEFQDILPQEAQHLSKATKPNEDVAIVSNVDVGAQTQPEVVTESQAPPQQPAQDTIAEAEVPLIITEAMLREISEVTSKILDQYLADTEDGADKEGSARFYHERIISARHAFWFKQLKAQPRLLPF